MVSCTLCASHFHLVSLLLTHIRLVHADQPSFRIQCNLQGCKRTFKKFTVYRNHIYHFHDTHTLEDSSSNGEVGSGGPENLSETEDGTTSEVISPDDNTSGQSPTGFSHVSPDELKDAAARWVLKTSECHKIPQSTMDDIISDVQSLFSTAITSMVSSTMDSVGVDLEVKEKVIDNLNNTTPLFAGLGSSYKRRQLYKRKFGLVEPVKIVLGTERKPKGYGRKRRTIDVEETMVYVPILETLQRLLQNETVVSEIKRSHQSEDPDLLGDFCDGEAFKRHPLFSVRTHSLQILFYYDDIEVCNPLGSKKKIHKLGIFYFTLGNLRPKYRSKYASIQLLIACKREFITKYSLNAVLQPLVDDLKTLEGGHTFELEGRLEICHGTLALTSADNPAGNALGGFKESSSARRHCRQCLGSSDEATKEFDESKYQLRTLAEHLRHCQEVEDDGEEASVLYGVNHRSVLLELRFFDICSGALLPDVMHDVLEGVLQYEAKLLLRHCIEKKYFSGTTLSNAIETVEVGYMEADNRPAMVTTKTLRSVDNKLGQNASQMWLLGRVLPFLLGEYVPEDDERWKCYLQMLSISGLLLAPEITKDEVGYLGMLLTEHHRNFVQIYPDESVLPKMHYLIHTPRLILQYGPLSRQWTMRYEAKHNYLKKLARSIGNFINIAWTVAIRHQQWQCYKWLDGEALGQEQPDIGPGEPVAHGDVPSELVISSECYVTKWAQVDGVKYMRDGAVILEVADDYPVFGQVEAIYVVDNDIVLYLCVMSTSFFHEHYHSYVIHRTTTFKAVPVTRLYSPTVQHIRRLTIDGSPSLVIVPKFHIVRALQA